MTDIDKFAKFTKTYYKLGDFSAKHVINITNYTTVNGNKESAKSPIYVYDTFDKRIMQPRKGLSLSVTEDCITLANNAKVQPPVSSSNEKVNNKTKSGFVYIIPRDFDLVLDAMDKCVSWLCDPEWEKLYTVDASGNTVGVAENNEVAICRFRHGWLLFKPAVIFDKNGAGYQGIFMKTDRGVLASLTGSEFKEFYNYTKELMNNFYQCGLALYNAGILSMLLHKEK